MGSQEMAEPIVDQGRQVGGYVIKEFLGRGSLAYVYAAADEKGNETYVVKFMRHPGRDRDRADFQREVDVLIDLAQGEEELADGLQLVPRVRRVEFEGPKPYIVQDRARGQKVSRLLEERGFLDEAMVAEIGWQMCRLLDLLHTRLERSYTDLKLENIWWDGLSRRIMVTDWNVVSERQDQRVAADLERLGQFLYWMLIGHSPEYVTERWAGIKRWSEEALAERGGERWEGLTWGMRRLLVDLLVIPASGQPPYPTAAAAGSRLRWLAEAWGKAWYELRDELEQSPDLPPGDALTLAEILYQQNRTPQSEQILAQRRREVEGESRIARVRAWLEASNIGEAIQVAMEESERGRDRLRGTRWLYAASAAWEKLDFFVEHRSDVLRALDAFDEGRFDTARATFRDLSYRLRSGEDRLLDIAGYDGIAPCQRAPGSREYACLSLDAAFCFHMSAGEAAERDGEWEKAGQEFDQAAKALDGILGVEAAYVDLLRRRKGNPVEWKESLRRRSEAERKAADHYEQARQATEPLRMAEEIERSLRARGDNRRPLELARKKALECLGKEDLQGAMCLAEVGLRFAPGERIWNALLRAASLLVELEKAIPPAVDGPLSWQTAFHLIGALLDVARQEPDLKEPVGGRVARPLELLINQAERTEDEILWKELEGLLSDWGDLFPSLQTRMQDLRHSHEQWLQNGYTSLLGAGDEVLKGRSVEDCRAVLSRVWALQKVTRNQEWKDHLDKLGGQIERYIQQLEWAERQRGRLDQAERQLGQAVGEYDFSQVEGILNQVEQDPLLSELRPRLDDLRGRLKQARENATQVEELLRELRLYNEYLQKVWAQPELARLVVVSDLPLRLKIGGLCAQILRLHPGHQEAQQILADVRLYREDVQWPDTLPSVGEMIEKLRKELEKGFLPEVPAELRKVMEQIAPLAQKWGELDNQFQNAKMLQEVVEKASEGRPEASSRLEELCDRDLPPAHWKEAARQLEELLKRQCEQFKEKMGDARQLREELERSLRIARMFDLADRRAKGQPRPPKATEAQVERFIGRIVEEFARIRQEE